MSTRHGFDTTDATIIGEVSEVGKLFYDGRQQGSTFYGLGDKELTAQAKAIQAEIKARHGAEHYAWLYPNPQLWEMRVY